MNTENIGALISKLRKEKGMTQQELADKLKITDKAVSKCERGGQRGQRPHLAYDFAEQSVVCYTLCGRCRENAVAAGEGKGI